MAALSERRALQDMRVLVTGCCGRIGAAACRELLAACRSVRGLDVFAACPDGALAGHADFEYVAARVEDAAAVAAAVDGCDAVVHLAGCPDDADWETALLPSNVQGTANVLRAVEATPSVRRVVLASSGKLFAGYGPARCPIEATAPPRPVCAYGATKAFVEAAGHAFAARTEIPTVALRFGWCPRTADDVAAMRRLGDDDPDEFLAPRDAASAVVAAALEELGSYLPANMPGIPFRALFVQSRPAPGRSPRFDVLATYGVLKNWRPAATFPDGIDAIAAARADPGDARLKPRGAAGGVFAPFHPRGVRSRVSAEEWALRVDLAAAYRVFAQHGWTHSIHTHITVKCPGAEELFLINPYGLLWEEITASSLVKVRANGAVVDNGSTDLGINPAGFKIHSAIHTSPRGRAGGDVLWTMHTHARETVAVASTAGGLRRGLSQFAMDLGPVATHAFEHATAGDHVCAKLVADLGPRAKVLLMENHGCLTVGATVGEAYFRLLQLIRACEVQVDTPLAGAAEVPADRVDATFAITEKNYTGSPFGALEWKAAVRRMERAYGDAYRA